MEYIEAQLRAAEFKQKLKLLLKEYDAEITINETLYCAYGERDQAISIYLSATFEAESDVVIAEAADIMLPPTFDHTDL